MLLTIVLFSLSTPFSLVQSIRLHRDVSPLITVRCSHPSSPFKPETSGTPTTGHRSRHETPREIPLRTLTTLYDSMNDTFFFDTTTTASSTRSSPSLPLYAVPSAPASVARNQPHPQQTQHPEHQAGQQFYGAAGGFPESPNRLGPGAKSNVRETYQTSSNVTANPDANL